MKLKLVLSILITIFISGKNLFAQAVNVTDSLALVDLYNSTHGEQWNQNYNWLTGPVKSWYGITVQGTRVTGISLDYNKLNGPLPASIGNLTAVTDIGFDINQLGGTIPPSMGNLINLRSLYMYKCHFTGTIPTSFGNLKSLEILVLHNNELTGTIPASLRKLKNLSALYLYNNHLSGNLPLFILTSPVLYNVDVHSNQLTFNYNIPADTSSKKGNMELQLNKFTFDGLEYAAQKSAANNEFYVTYAPQDNIHVHQYGNKLAVYAGGTLSNNTYRWYKVGKTGSKVIQGDSVFTPSASGQYYAKITNNIATKLTLLTDTVSYIVSNDSRLQVSVYPNPVKNYLYISRLNAALNTTITITGVNGIAYFTTQLQQQSNFKWNAGKLQPGNYILTITSGADVYTYHFLKE